MTKSYYKIVNGKKYDREIIEIAENAIKKSTGKIEVGDAERIFLAISDGNKYTEREKATMAYIRKKGYFSEEADRWLRSKIRKWSAEHKNMAKTKESPQSKTDRKELKEAPTANSLTYNVTSCTDSDKKIKHRDYIKMGFYGVVLVGALYWIGRKRKAKK